MTNTAIVIGAGIVGLATARALAVRGHKVKVFERSQQAVGASVRNFGMVWPIGQPIGELYETALRSRSIWKETCMEAGIWHSENGSLHLAGGGTPPKDSPPDESPDSYRERRRGGAKSRLQKPNGAEYSMAFGFESFPKEKSKKPFHGIKLGPAHEGNVKPIL